MSQLKDSPRDIGCEAAGLVSVLEAESSLDAETTGKILMAHELIVLLGKVAVDGQRAVDFVDKGRLIVWQIIRISGLV